MKFRQLIPCAALLATMLSLPFALDPSAAAPSAGDSAPAADKTDWPCWRGPNLDGKSADKAVPLKWSKTENVVWRADVPGRGHSSPIVVGERVFLTTADPQRQQQAVLAFDRATGKSLWSTVAHQGGFMPMHGKNSQASATSACDGERVFSVFINGGLLRVTATDLDGMILWQQDAGKFGSEHGYGSSPVIHGSNVIVLGDNMTGSFIAALNRETGKVAWRTDRKTTGKHGSYATPIVATFGGKPQLLVSGMESTSSYHPDTGKLIWSVAGPAEVTACTPAFSDKLVFSSGGYPEKALLAIRPNGSGDVTRSHVAWRAAKGVTYVPSPLFHAGKLYVVSDDSIASCFDAATGKQLWQERLDGGFSSSPVLAGDHLFVTNEAGKTFVLKTGSKFEVTAQNDLGDGGFATPAVCGGQIFLRTGTSLYCIGGTGDRAARR